MSPLHFSPGTGKHAIAVTRVAETQWHALDDGHVIGHGDASRRHDGRLFLSIDSWHPAGFDQLAEAMLAALPKPLYTIVDETDLDLTSSWERVGFTTRRREWELLVPTDPGSTGLGSVLPPPGVTIMAAGSAKVDPLRILDRAIRDEVEASVGWREMPAEVLPRLDEATVLDPSKYAVAAQSDRYVGLIRLAQVTRQPRIGLIAVRAEQQRNGIARALLAHALGSLHLSGIETASAEVNESNGATAALFDGIGARRVSSNLEFVCQK